MVEDACVPPPHTNSWTPAQKEAPSAAQRSRVVLLSQQTREGSSTFAFIALFFGKTIKTNKFCKKIKAL